MVWIGWGRPCAWARLAASECLAGDELKEFVGCFILEAEFMASDAV